MRRSLATAALVAALGGLVACVGTPPGTVPNSLSSYDRTFDTALGAMTDQKLDISQQERRLGTIVGTLGEVSITATLQPLFDGTTRVTFKQQGEAPADPGLLKRVVDSYNERMSHAKILPSGLL
jgi:hypothetical protein